MVVNNGCVYFDKSMKRNKRWRARIVLNGITHQKRFLTEQEGKDYLEERKNKVKKTE
jgi:hypothetical protein